MKEKIKETKGITLIALVVTILVLIILTSIAVGTIGGENGLLTKAKEVEQNEALAQEEGQARINELNSQNVLYGGGATSSTDTTAPIINSTSVSNATTTSFTMNLNITEQESQITNISYMIVGIDSNYKSDLINPTSRSYTFTGLTEDTNYSVKIKVTNSKGLYTEQTVIGGTGVTPVNKVYSYTGGEQIVTIPYTGKYKLEVWGAQGGYRSSDTYAGKGGYSEGEILLNQGNILHIYVGGAGGNNSTSTGAIVNGGYNGGGYRYGYCGGGGATDIRIVRRKLE